MDPERVHHFALLALTTLSRAPWLLNLIPRLVNQHLAKEVFGIRFPNPIGLAAGFDKNGVALAPGKRWASVLLRLDLSQLALNPGTQFRGFFEFRTRKP